MSTNNVVWTPADVFYVVLSVESNGVLEHRVSSVLFETRPQAEAELDRLKRNQPGVDYNVWHSETYVEPHRWLYPIVLADGTVVPGFAGPPSLTKD